MYSKYYFKIIIYSLIGLILIFFGITLDRLYLTHNPTKTKVIKNQSEEIPVVEILSIGEGSIKAKISGGKVYLKAGDEIATANEKGELSLPIWDAFVNFELNPVPENAKFVASKNGKKYYSLDSAMANRISPQNRIYFSSSEEAKNAGYTK